MRCGKTGITTRKIRVATMNENAIDDASRQGAISDGAGAKADEAGAMTVRGGSSCGVLLGGVGKRRLSGFADLLKCAQTVKAR